MTLLVVMSWSRPLRTLDVPVMAVLMCEGSSWTAICDVGIPLRSAVLCKHKMTHYFDFQNELQSDLTKSLKMYS